MTSELLTDIENKLKKENDLSDIKIVIYEKLNLGEIRKTYKNIFFFIADYYCSPYVKFYFRISTVGDKVFVVKLERLPSFLCKKYKITTF